MARQFFFGCSFTLYKYPTWADILIKNSNIESYNYGISGASNETIAKTVTFADLKHNFTHDDKLYIMWTHWWRKNLATRNGGWKCRGNVFRTEWPISYCKKFINYTDLAIANTNAIIQTNKAYNIEKNLHWIKPSELEGGERYNPTTDELAAIQYMLPFIPADDILPPYDDETDVYWKKDGHPTVEWHLKAAKNITNINNTTEQWTNQIHTNFSQMSNKEYWGMDNWEEKQDVFPWRNNGNK